MGEDQRGRRRPSPLASDAGGHRPPESEGRGFAHLDGPTFHTPQTADNSMLESGAARRNPDFKPYTGKVSKEYVRLGTLKPDLNNEELVAKRANAERVKLFSKNLRVINQQQEEERQPNVTSAAAPAAISKHQKAKEYARNVPKPRPREVEADEVCKAPSS